MNFGRAALVLAASSAFLACAQITGLSGFGFGSGGGSTTSGGGTSGSHGGAAGTGGTGGISGQGGAPDTTASSANSAVSSSFSASSGPVSSAMSSGSTGSGGSCSGGDPGVCCPVSRCATTCCHDNMGFTCQGASCDTDEIRCDSSSDCNGGTICCGYYDGNDYTMGIRCQATCPRPSSPGQPGTYEICSRSNPVCLTGGTCDQSVSLPGDYGFCF